jgi:hypothetical protein
MRYRIRQEIKGSFVFDKVKRTVFPLKEEDLKLLLSVLKKELPFQNLPVRLLEKQFFKKNGDLNFQIIDPTDINEPKKSHGINCLSAPNRIYIELTRQCNLRCLMCYNAAGRALPNELTTEQLKVLLDELEKIGVFEVRSNLQGIRPPVN